ncbi:MAG: hypothetical protein IPK16_26760 [Anaerolineales bacterium]|nr:hypothetical protein [Anaerolineales bacterium]
MPCLPVAGNRAAALVVPVVWLTLGWFVTWFSVTAPILYLVPLAIGLLVPVYQNRRNAARYTRESGDWTGLTISILVAGALIYGSYLVLKFLAPIVLPLVGQLLLMSGFAVVMAAFMVLAVGWIAGMLHALRAQEKAIPVFGGWGDRFFAWLT